TRWMISSVSCVSSSTPASLGSDDQRAVARRSRRAKGESDPRAQGNSEGPRRDSQHPAYQRPPTTKEIRRQRATTPIFTQERAPPHGGTAAYQQNAGNRCAQGRFRTHGVGPCQGACRIGPRTGGVDCWVVVVAGAQVGEGPERVRGWLACPH